MPWPNSMKDFVLQKSVSLFKYQCHNKIFTYKLKKVGPFFPSWPLFPRPSFFRSLCSSTTLTKPNKTDKHLSILELCEHNSIYHCFPSYSLYGFWLFLLNLNISSFFLQSFGFSRSGEYLTMRVRQMTFYSFLRQVSTLIHKY